MQRRRIEVENKTDDLVLDQQLDGIYDAFSEAINREVDTHSTRRIAHLR